MVGNKISSTELRFWSVGFGLCKFGRLQMREIEKIKGLIKEFSEGVVKHREQMFSDHVVANRFYEKYLSALKDLTSYGAPGLSALAELLDNPRPIIRVAAATYLISVYPEKAKK